VGILLGILVITLFLAYLKQRKQKAVDLYVDARWKDEERYYADQWAERKRLIQKADMQRVGRNNKRRSNKQSTAFRYGGTD
jgi:hypothetical protein